MSAAVQPKPRPRVYPKRPHGALIRFRRDLGARDAAWSEGDHPRASNGQFGSGSKIRIVTTHDPDTGEADKAVARVSDDDDFDFEPELHEARVRGEPGERTDALRIVHSGDGAAGVSIHGAFTSYGRARAAAHDASQAEWEENGPRRSEVGLSDLEKVDVAQAWNDDHAADNDDVRIKTDADGDPILDDAGEFQFEQDGKDVEPDEDHLAALAEVQEELYPEDDVAAYPGLEDANEHFRDEGRHEAVFEIHTHEAQPKRAPGAVLGKILGGAAHDAARRSPVTDAALALAFDQVAAAGRRHAGARAAR